MGQLLPPWQRMIVMKTTRRVDAAGEPRKAPRRNPLGDLDGDGEATAGFGLPGGAPGQGAVLEVNLDHARAQLAADQLLGERIFDVALNRPAQRPGAVGAVAAGGIDNPVDD